MKETISQEIKKISDLDRGSPNWSLQAKLGHSQIKQFY